MFFFNRCVGVSDQLQLFAKEQEHLKLLYSSASQASDTTPATPITASGSTARGNAKTSASKKKSGRGRDKDAEEAQQMCDDQHVDTGSEGLDGNGGRKRGRPRAKTKTAGKRGCETGEQTQAGNAMIQDAPAECE